MSDYESDYNSPAIGDPREPSARALPGPSLSDDRKVIDTVPINKSKRRLHVETAWKYRKLAHGYRSSTPSVPTHYQMVYFSLRRLINKNFLRNIYRRRELRGDGRKAF